MQNPFRTWYRADAIAALESNLWSMWSIFGRPTGASLSDTPQLFAFETPVPRIPYNAVMRTRFSGACPEQRMALEQAIDSRIASCQRRRTPLVWVINPTAQPVDLAGRLRHRGLEHVDDLFGMIADISDIAQWPVQVDDDIELFACRPNEPADWINMVSWRYDIPAELGCYLRGVYDSAQVGDRTLLWVAHQNGIPVSKAAVRLAGGVAGVYGVATNSRARGLGLAWKCTVRALQDARQRGYKTAVLHSTAQAASMYTRMGFSDVAPFQLFTRPGELDLSKA